MGRTTVCVVLASVVALVGCGGSNSSSSSSSPGGGSGGTGGAGETGAAETGLVWVHCVRQLQLECSGSEMVGNLSASDQQKLCGELVAYLNGSTYQSGEVKASCGVAGILAAVTATDQTDAGIQAACKTAYDDCATMITSAPPDVPVSAIYPTPPAPLPSASSARV